MKSSPAVLPLPYHDKPDPWSSHSVITTWVRALPPGARVLDVGTASGSLARRCADCGHHWRGLEPQAEWAELARPAYAEFFMGRVEDAPDDFLSPADLVILADILEHLPDPGAVLARIVRLQPAETRFALSLPNVANLYVRLSLLVGRFDYAERGILDRTHLRFFTRKSLEQLLADCGLEIVELNATPLPLNLVHPFFEKSWAGRLAHRALALLTRLWPRLLGYQFVTLAQKSSNRDVNDGS